MSDASSNHSTPSILTTPQGASLAYFRRDGKTPGVAFLHGLQSDMGGSKALAVEAWCEREGRAFLRFDQQGHGQSSGAFSEASIGVWSQDTAYALEALMDGPAILVGSSMGGWMMLLAALHRPDLVAGLVGIAAAPDFTASMTPENPLAKEYMTTDGGFRGPEPNDPDFPRLELSPAFIADGNVNCVLDRGALDIRLPIRLIHGLRDQTVPWKTALAIQQAVVSEDVTVTLVKDGEHRLARAQDLDLLIREIGGLARQIESAL